MARQHDAASTLLRSWPAVVGLQLLSLAACDRGSDSESLVAEQSLTAESAPKDAAGAFRGEVPSSPAIVVRWADAESTFVGDKLDATVENTTLSPILVELELSGTDPCGEIVTRPLGNRRIDAKSVVTLTIPVKDVPAQSVGLASSVQLIAMYDGGRFRPSNGSERTRVRMFTQTVELTFAEDFGSATIRNQSEQAKVNTELYNEKAAKVDKLRRFAKASGVHQEVSAADLGSCEVGMAMHGRPEFLKNLIAAGHVPFGDAGRPERKVTP